MTPITVNQLIEVLLDIVAQDEQSGLLPCYVHPEGGQDILEKWEVKVELPCSQHGYLVAKKLPKRLLIGQG